MLISFAWLLFILASCLICADSAKTITSQSNPSLDCPNARYTGTESYPGQTSDCYFMSFDMPYLAWKPFSVTATITAETIIHVVNKYNNNTRTETITNKEANPTEYKRTDVNSAGTRVASISVWDGSKSIETTLAFPTGLTAYGSIYEVGGIIPTSVGGIPTCITATDGMNFTLSSSPGPPPPSVLPTQIEALYGPADDAAQLSADPRGWTYQVETEGYGVCSGFESAIRPLYPSLGVWKCQSACVAPAIRQMTALYLTHTSTSTESDHPSTSADAQPSSMAPKSSRMPPPSPTAAPMLNPAPTSGSNTLTPKFSVDAMVAGTVTSPARVSDWTGSSSIMSNTVSKGNGEAKAEDSGLASAAGNGPAQDAALPWQLQTIATTASVHNDAHALAVTSVPTAPTNRLSLPIKSVEDKTSSFAFAPPPIIFNSQTLTPDSFSHYIVGDQTLAAGLSITLRTRKGDSSGTQVIALHTTSSQTVLVIGSSTSTLQPAPTQTLSETSKSGAANIIINDQTITPDSASQYIISSQTLVLGSTVTLGSGSDAQVVALHTSSSQTVLVVGNTTSTVQGPNTGGASEPVDYGGPIATSFTGGANRMDGGILWATITAILFLVFGFA